jgi:UDP-N-acetylglucosamine--N-acetylmuramyl-(pentapeptide) pyrophosphoryl-undecaprenol N-acetylglucosamine transferase
VGNTLYDEAALLLRERDRREKMIAALQAMAVPNAGEKIYETLREIMR